MPVATIYKPTAAINDGDMHVSDNGERHVCVGGFWVPVSVDTPKHTPRVSFGADSLAPIASTDWLMQQADRLAAHLGLGATRGLYLDGSAPANLQAEAPEVWRVVTCNAGPWVAPTALPADVDDQAIDFAKPTTTHRPDPTYRESEIGGGKWLIEESRDGGATWARFGTASPDGAFAFAPLPARDSDRPGIAAMAAKKTPPEPATVYFRGEKVNADDLAAALALIRKAPEPVNTTPRGLLTVAGFDHRLGLWNRA